MTYKRKFSLFISSTYEDLKEERQEAMRVALENGYIPVGMEQFHAAPTDQWSIITKMIDECDFYLLIIGGCYGSIEESSGMSYTEKEYRYAKKHNIPVLAVIQREKSITQDKMDKTDKWEKQKLLEIFRKSVKDGGNTVDFFENINELKYCLSASLKRATEYAADTAGWVRYIDVQSIIDERIEQVKQETEEHIRVEQDTLIFNSDSEPAYVPIVGKEDVGSIPLDTAFLLVFAAEADGRILRIQTLGSAPEISTSRNQFMEDGSVRESARWQEALDQLVSWGWVKPVGNKGEIFELTGTGFRKADWLKEAMNIDTNRDPIEEMKEFH